MLQLLFSAFPGGLPGMSLLLVRAVLGIAMIIDGGTYFEQPVETFVAVAIGASALILGILLLLGFLTPFVGLLAGVNLIVAAISAIPAPTPNLFASEPALIFALATVVAIVGVGPGRFSIDARVFGRREIIIPLPQSSLDR